MLMSLLLLMVELFILFHRNFVHNAVVIVLMLPLFILWHCFIIYAAVVVDVDADIIYSMALLHYLFYRTALLCILWHC